MTQIARKKFSRARSEAEKSDRRHAILAAAETLLDEAGIEQLSMNILAARAQVAKGTLYLYFGTKEELLLTLFVTRLSRWSGMLKAGTQEGMADAAFCDLFLRLAKSDPLFIDLSSRLTNVIEKNVSLERFSEAKRAMTQIVMPVAVHLEACLNLREGEGASVLTSFMALLLGAALFDSAEIFPAEQLPEDVAGIMDTFSCDDVFLRFAPLILGSLR